MSNRYNITINQGATFKLQLLWKPGGVAQDVSSGYFARMQIRPDYDSSSTHVSLTYSDGGITLSNSGYVTATITNSATAAMTFTKAVYDVELEDVAGTVWRLVEGVARTNKEATR